MWFWVGPSLLHLEAQDMQQDRPVHLPRGLAVTSLGQTKNGML